MKKLFFIGILFSFSFLQIKAQTVSPLPEKADTLSLQQICGYCVYGDGGYALQPFNNRFLCICYTDCKYDSPQFGELLKKYASDVKFLTIENPSNIVGFIDFSVFTSLQEVELVGNDSDWLALLPGDMLNLESLKKVTIRQIKMSTDTWNDYGGIYPTIEFVGTPEW